MPRVWWWWWWWGFISCRYKITIAIITDTQSVPPSQSYLDYSWTNLCVRAFYSPSSNNSFVWLQSDQFAFREESRQEFLRGIWRPTTRQHVVSSFQWCWERSWGIIFREKNTNLIELSCQPGSQDWRGWMVWPGWYYLLFSCLAVVRSGSVWLTECLPSIAT